MQAINRPGVFKLIHDRILTADSGSEIFNDLPDLFFLDVIGEVSGSDLLFRINDVSANYMRHADPLVDSTDASNLYSNTSASGILSRGWVASQMAVIARNTFHYANGFCHSAGLSDSSTVSTVTSGRTLSRVASGINGLSGGISKLEIICNSSYVLKAGSRILIYEP